MDYILGTSHAHLNVQCCDVHLPVAAQQVPEAGPGPAEVAVNELLHVGAGLSRQAENEQRGRR